MGSRLLTTIAILAVVALSFVTIGFAYTASTENSGNTVVSEYVVLDQTNYDVTSEDIKFDTITTELGTVYQLVGTAQKPVEKLLSIDGKDYYGIQLGNSDTLSAAVVGSTKTVIDVTVNTLNLNNSLYTEFSELFDWRYVLKVSGTGVPDQYAYYDGSGTDDLVQWKTVNTQSPIIADVTTGTIPGSWKVWGSGDVQDGYTVNESDAKFGFIIIVDQNVGGLSGCTVVKISDGKVTFETGKNNGDTIANPGSNKWKPWGGNAVDSYVVDTSTARNGFIVLVDSGESSLGELSVIEIRSTLSIEKDKVYTTKLYFAGVGEIVSKDSFVKGVGSIATVKTNSVVTTMWVLSSEDDIKCVLKSGNPPNATSNSVSIDDSQYTIYFDKGVSFMLPEDLFPIPDGYVFAGWYNEVKNKVYSPRYVLDVTKDMEFTARWEVASNTSTIHYIADNTVKMEQKSSGGSVEGDKWKVWGTGTASSYAVVPSDVKEGTPFIVLQHEAVTGLNGFTVIRIDSTGGGSFVTGLKEGDVVKGNWKVWGTGTASDYTVNPSHAKEGFIVIVENSVGTLTSYQVVELDKTWTNSGVVMGSEYIYSVLGGHFVLPANEFNMDGKRFCGWTISDPDSSDLLSPGAYNTISSSVKDVTVYAHWEPWNSSTSVYKQLTFIGGMLHEVRQFNVYTDEKGRYIMPDSFFIPIDTIQDETKGWKFLGWNITTGSNVTRIVAQSYTMPVGTDTDSLVKNGVMKFIYESDSP